MAQQEILKLLDRKPIEIESLEIARVLNLSKSAARQNLSRLYRAKEIARRKIIKIGKNRRVYWVSVWRAK